MFRTGPLSRPRVVVASSDEVQRCALEADLLRFGMDVQVSATVAEAQRYFSRQHADALVVTFDLAGGGGVALCAELPPTLPIVMVMPADATTDQRHAGSVAGAHVLLQAPIFAAGVRAAIDQAAADASSGLFSGDLRSWSLADVIRRCELLRWSGEVVIHRPEAMGRVQLQGGVVVWAECGELQAERALLPMLSWQSGFFHSKPDISEASRLGRNVHRSNDALLLDGLGQSIIWQRELAVVPGVDLPHRVDDHRARRLGIDTPLVRALSRLLDGQRTLFEAARAAGIESIEGAQQVRSLIESGIVRPSTGVHFDDSADVGPPLDEATPEQLEAEIDQAVGIISRGKTISRRLNLEPVAGPATPPGEFAFEETDDRIERKRRKQKLVLALAGVVVLVAGLMTMFMLNRTPAGTVEVEVIEQTDGTP